MNLQKFTDGLIVSVMGMLVLFLLLVGVYSVSSYTNQEPQIEQYEFHKRNLKTGYSENHIAKVNIMGDKLIITDDNSVITINMSSLKINAKHYDLDDNCYERVSGNIDKLIINKFGIITIQFGDYNWVGKKLNNEHLKKIIK